MADGILLADGAARGDGQQCPSARERELRRIEEEEREIELLERRLTESTAALGESAHRARERELLRLEEEEREVARLEEERAKRKRASFGRKSTVEAEQKLMASLDRAEELKTRGRAREEERRRARERLEEEERELSMREEEQDRALEILMREEKEAQERLEREVKEAEERRRRRKKEKAEAKKRELLRTWKELKEEEKAVKAANDEKVKALTEEVERLERKRNPEMECAGCLDITRKYNGVSCPGGGGEGHFLCRECFEEYVQSWCNSEGATHEKFDGQVPCSGQHCSHVFDNHLLAKLLSAGLFEQVLEVQKNVVEQRVCAEQSKVMEEKLARAVEDLQSVEGVVRQHRNTINERVLSLRCPRCDIVFLDFTGCTALKCHNCPCGFCGWCLQDCGTDAHQHVKGCPHKLVQDNYYDKQSMITEAGKRLRQRRLDQYLVKIKDRAVRKKVLDAIHADCEAHGVMIPLE